MINVNDPQPRTGCKNMWNAFMVKEASFDVGTDMPICISTNTIPKSFILYEDAKKIYKKKMIKHNKDLFIDSFIMFYLDDHSIPVINNVRWGTFENWGYCFAGIPIGSTVVGSVASGIRKLNNRPIFEEGLKKMVVVIKPKRIIFYGSANYVFIKNLREQGIEIISIPSKTSQAYKEVRK